MLKYKYDLAKKKIFLSFWQIEKVDNYAKKAKNVSTYFCYFAKLSRRQQQALIAILLYSQKKGEVQIKNDQLKVRGDEPLGIPVIDWKVTTADKEYLDDVHFISISKNRILLHEVRDTAYLTSEALDFFKKIHFLKHPFQIFQPDTKGLSLSALDETSSELAQAYLFYNNISEKQTKELLANPGVLPCISPHNTSSLYLHLDETSGIQPFDGAEGGKSNEKLAYLVHGVDSYIHESNNPGVFLQTFNQKHLPIEKEEIIDLVQKLFRLKISNSFHRLPFWHKVNVLFRIFFAGHTEIAEELLQFEARKVYHPIIFCRFLNRSRFENNKEPLSTAALEMLQKKLKWMGLIQEEEKGYRVSRRSLLKLWMLLPAKNKNVTQGLQLESLEQEAALDHREDRLLIDTDMHITIYREYIIPEVFYLVLNIGQLSIDEHLITASWNFKRSSFCEMVGMGYKRLERWLKLAAPSTFNQNVLDHLKSYFLLSNGVEVTRGYVLKAFSHTLLEKMLFVLEENQLPFVKLGELEGKQVIFFNRERDYLKAKILLKEKNILFF